MLNPSLSVEPDILATSKPSPISMPLMAPMDIMALEILASSLSNTGSPIPAGILFTIHSIIPPHESISAIFSPKIFSAAFAASESGI